MHRASQPAAAPGLCEGHNSVSLPDQAAVQPDKESPSFRSGKRLKNKTFLFVKKKLARRAWEGACFVYTGVDTTSLAGRVDEQWRERGKQITVNNLFGLFAICFIFLFLNFVQYKF